jgi:hypothetical protein
MGPRRYRPDMPVLARHRSVFGLEFATTDHLAEKGLSGYRALDINRSQNHAMSYVWLEEARNYIS